MTLWLVREGADGENEQFALENNVVAIGWGELPDLSKITSREELRELYETTYPDESKNATSNYVGQVWAFYHSISKGDLVALPLKSTGSIALGKITGKYEHHPEHPVDAKHSRSVEWIRKDVPRSDFAQDLLYSLGAFMTVCRISRNNAKQRVEQVINGSKDPGLQEQIVDVPEIDTDTDLDSGPEPQTDMEVVARDQIRMRIETRFKGHKLATLVKTLLEAQGYSAVSSPPGADGGVDILAGKGSLGFDTPRLCIQVKSGSSKSDVRTVRELEGVMGRVGADQGLFVSWGGYTDSVMKESRGTYFKVRLWHAEHLIDAILEHYENLPEEIQTELSLKRIWVIVPQVR